MLNSEFFRFNRRERRALFLLLPFLIILSILSALVQKQEDIGLSSEEWEKAKILFLQGSTSKEFQADNLRINFMDSASFVASGLSPKQSSAILKSRFTNSGFADLSDVYECQYFPEYWIEANFERFDFSGFPLNNEIIQDGSLYSSLQSFNDSGYDFIIEKQPVSTSNPNAIRVNLNLADSATLEQLPGIGAGMAGRIIKFRDRLGGFIRPEQLLEVYGMKMDNYLKFSHLVFIEKTFSPDLICINTCSKEELANHPYIQRRIANSLINVREQHGPYKELEGLKFSALMNDSIYELIRPYISICSGSSTRDP